MPNYHFTDEEIQMLTALVLSFAAEEEKELRPIPFRFKVAGKPEAQPTVFASEVDRGKAVYQKYGCAACHGMEGRGGVRNKNMDMGEEVSPLTFVSQGYSKEEIREIIREGRFPARAESDGMSPPLWMPAWKDKISEEEMEALVAYLMSLADNV